MTRQKQPSQFSKFLKKIPIKWVINLTLVGLFLIILYSPPVQYYLDEAELKLDQTFSDWGLSAEIYSIDGRQYTAQSDVLDAVEQTNRHSLPFYDLKTALDNLNNLPWVYKASISKKYPQTLYIKIEEKIPSAHFQKNQKLYVIDQFGEIIEGADASKFYNLKLFLGNDANLKAESILKTLALYPKLKKITSALKYVDHRRWDLYLSNKTLVKMPEDGFTTGLKTLQSLDDIGSLLHRRVKVIDLRIKHKVIIESENNKKFEY